MFPWWTHHWTKWVSYWTANTKSNKALILTLINAFRPLFILILNFNSLSHSRIVLFSRRPKDLNLCLVCLSGQFHSFCFLTATHKSCFKVPRQNDSHSTCKSVAATIKCSSSSLGNHVVIWFSNVHFLYNCVPLFVHGLQHITRLHYLRQFLRYRYWGEPFFYSIVNFKLLQQL